MPTVVAHSCEHGRRPFPMTSTQFAQMPPAQPLQEVSLNMEQSPLQAVLAALSHRLNMYQQELLALRKRDQLDGLPPASSSEATAERCNDHHDQCPIWAFAVSGTLLISRISVQSTHVITTLQASCTFEERRECTRRYRLHGRPTGICPTIA